MSNTFILATTARLLDLLSTGQRAYCKSQDTDVFIHASPSTYLDRPVNYHKRIVDEGYFHFRDIPYIVSLELLSRMQLNYYLENSTDPQVIRMRAPVTVHNFSERKLKILKNIYVTENVYASHTFPKYHKHMVIEAYDEPVSHSSEAKHLTFVTSTDVELAMSSVVTHGVPRTEALLASVRSFLTVINKHMPPLTTVTVGITGSGKLFVVDAITKRIEGVCDDIVYELEQNFLDYVIAGIDLRKDPVASAY